MSAEPGPPSGPRPAPGHAVPPTRTTTSGSPQPAIMAVVDAGVDITTTLGLWLALVILTGVLTATLADALPGVEAFAPLEPAARTSALAMGALMVAVAIASQGMRGHAGSLRSAVRAGAARWVVFTDGIGLSSPRYRWPVLLGLGALGGVAAIVCGEVLVRVPALTATAAGPDARLEAISSAPAWSAAAYFAVYSPLPEEIAYRGMLLVVLAGTATRVTSRTTRRALIVLTLVVSSAVFGLHHLDWSALNAVSAGVNGLVYGILAVRSRSLWPAVLAHTLHNLWAGAGAAGLVP